MVAHWSWARFFSPLFPLADGEMRYQPKDIDCLEQRETLWDSTGCIFCFDDWVCLCVCVFELKRKIVRWNGFNPLSRRWDEMVHEMMSCIWTWRMLVWMFFQQTCSWSWNRSTFWNSESKIISLIHRKLITILVTRHFSDHIQFKSCAMHSCIFPTTKLISSPPPSSIPLLLIDRKVTFGAHTFYSTHRSPRRIINSIHSRRDTNTTGVTLRVLPRNYPSRQQSLNMPQDKMSNVALCNWLISQKTDDIVSNKKRSGRC